MRVQWDLNLRDIRKLRIPRGRMFASPAGSEPTQRPPARIRDALASRPFATRDSSVAAPEWGSIPFVTESALRERIGISSVGAHPATAQCRGQRGFFCLAPRREHPGAVDESHAATGGDVMKCACVSMNGQNGSMKSFRVSFLTRHTLSLIHI